LPYPCATILAERFEISRKQAQRDVEFMKERLAAPLIYDANRCSCAYMNDGYELPPVWLKEEELVALCLAQRQARG
jgi:predicted DNA-binding transcriptional regulator YafY